MMGSFITRGLVMVFGYAYPAYECFKTVEKNKPEIEQLRFWCQYWILVAVLTVFERVGDTFVSWVPMYSEAKLAFFIYLWYPKTKGTAYVYDSFFRPYVAKHEMDIDRSILELRTRAGDFAIQYWQRAASYGQTRVFEVLQYVASQSTTRPRPAQQATGARQPPPTAPPPTLRPRQPAATQQQPTPQQQPPACTTSTASTQQQQVPSHSSSTASSQQPPYRISSTATTQQTQEPAQDKVPACTNSAPSAAAVPTGADQPAAKLSSQSSQSSQSDAELMQIEVASSSGNENVNPPPNDTVMEETKRMTRARLRKNKDATNR